MAVVSSIVSIGIPVGVKVVIAVSKSGNVGDLAPCEPAPVND